MKKLAVIFVCLSVFSFFLSCSSDGKDDDTTKVSTSDFDIYLPDNVKVYNSVKGDFDGVVVYAGKNAASSDSKKKSDSSAELTDLDVSGIIFQVPVTKTDAGEILADVTDSLMSSYLYSVVEEEADYSDYFQVDELASVGIQTFAQDSSCLGSYVVTLESSQTPTEFMNGMLQAVGLSESSGEVTSLMEPEKDELSTDSYRLFAGVKYNTEESETYPGGSAAILLVVVPEELVESYRSLARDLSSTNNVGPKGADLNSESDEFTTEASSGLADFLFVVDNSGSMSDNQNALSSAADTFVSVIQNSGLNYNIATITTDQFQSFETNWTTESLFKSDFFRDTNGDGYITSDLTEFKADLVAGDNGSATETGIWNAEHVLFSTTLGDNYNGFVSQEGMPRSNASLSVVILSDEVSQYDNADTNTGGTNFNLTDNLFVKRGYYVHSIVDSSDSSYSEYDDLSNNTGGTVADIDSTSAFSVIMDNIATQAGGASSQYLLSYTAIPSSITVKKNGSTVANSATNGWTYVQGNNSISFHGSALPAAGDTVQVSYEYFNTTTKGMGLQVITAVDALVEL